MSEIPEAESWASSQDPVPPSRPTLNGLLERYGRTEIPDNLRDSLGLALAAHAQRRQDRVADREALNRSTALWALLVSHPDVALAAAEGNVEAEGLKALLHIRDTLRHSSEPDAAGLPGTVVLDDSLARALDEHLSTLGPDELDAVAVTTAILLSCLRPGGLLPRRLDELKVDLPAAIDALQRMRAGVPSGLSRTVRDARRRLGPEAEVTASDVVGALRELHSPSQIARIDLSAVGGRVTTTDAWLSEVRGLYDAAEVLRSKRGIVDLELVVKGLFLREPALTALFEQDPVLMRWIEDIRPAPSAESRTEPSVDVPATKDLLGRESLAKTLLKQLDLIDERGEYSMLIHLDGPWGSGKSSLFVFLEDAIRAAGDDRYLVVDVNAWREQRVGAQWWTLYRALRVAHLSAARTFPRRLASRLGHLWDVILVRRDKLWPIALAMLVLAIGIWFVLGPATDSGIGVAEVLSVAAVVTTGLTAAYRVLVPVSPRSAKAMEETSTNPMAEVRDLFSRSIRRAAPRRVIFLIDDLDRCEADYVIRFLEVVQTLVRDATYDARRGTRRARARRKAGRGPYAVVAADGRWLRSAYEKAYGELVKDDVPGKPVGYRFLEKIFQMHIRLPNVEEGTKQRYYQSLLFPEDGRGASPTASDRQLLQEVESQISGVRTTEDLSALNRTIARIDDPVSRQQLRSTALEQATSRAVVLHQLHELTPFAELLDSNPRTIRLFVNAVSMQAYLRFLEGVSFELSGLALWAVMESRWPALADHLREHPDDVRVLESNDLRPPRLPDVLREVLVGPDVAAVLCSPRWGPFGPERIRACTGGSATGTRA